MRFGLRLVQHVGPARELVQLASLADEQGFDAVWFPHDPFMKHAWAMAAAVAERTSRVQIGSVQTTPYLNEPTEAATFLATLDELSGGRAALGYGLHTDEMVEWLGYDASDRVERIRDSVDTVRRLLRGETLQDEWYLRFEPLRPGPPIYVTPFGRDLLELSGEIGDGSLPLVMPPAAAPGVVEAIHAGARRAGRDPAEVDIAACVWLSIATDGQAAAATLRPIVAYFAPYFLDEQLEPAGLTREDFEPVREAVARADYDAAAAAVTDDMLRLAIVGTPENAVEAIGSLAAAGVTQVCIGGPLGPDPAEAVRLIGERVIPAFR
ncbi:MAG TPA: LLM class flavin-dependent oxidoreductase [Gaiellaceae bacterium]|nr:LLM class flavin-dependent oxidoreductase [Gaiellaceae bacterium]